MAPEECFAFVELKAGSSALEQALAREEVLALVSEPESGKFPLPYAQEEIQSLVLEQDALLREHANNCSAPMCPGPVLQPRPERTSVVRGCQNRSRRP